MESLSDRLKRFDKSSKVIKLFNPNASRSEFGCPLRLCLNTYVGCSHQCIYCYNNWMKGFGKPHVKTDFERAMKSDIGRIFEYGLDKLVVSISNSTDPLQEPLESINKNSLFALKTLKDKGLKVLILTKNPKKLLEEEYLHSMDPEKTALQISIAFLNERRNLEPYAPSISDRITSAEKLINKGFTKLAVRVDPILPQEIGGQTKEEISLLIKRLKAAGITHVISKVFRLVGAIQKINPVFYQAARDHYIRNGAKWHKNYYLLPIDKKAALLNIVYDACQEQDMTLSVCYEEFHVPGVLRCDLAESKLGCVQG